MAVAVDWAIRPTHHVCVELLKTSTQRPTTMPSEAARPTWSVDAWPPKADVAVGSPQSMHFAVAKGDPAAGACGKGRRKCGWSGGRSFSTICPSFGRRNFTLTKAPCKPCTWPGHQACAVLLHTSTCAPTGRGADAEGAAAVADGARASGAGLKCSWSNGSDFELSCPGAAPGNVKATVATPSSIDSMRPRHQACFELLKTSTASPGFKAFDVASATALLPEQGDVSHGHNQAMRFGNWHGSSRSRLPPPNSRGLCTDMPGGETSRFMERPVPKSSAGFPPARQRKGSMMSSSSSTRGVPDDLRWR
mmetsp:Transcript_75899/g.220393  ORF Transcript_75899/g.220393 Transcript_75899/m.220393 type:complete len:306 (-) Transcript_75899:29-946(-)